MPDAQGVSVADALIAPANSRSRAASLPVAISEGLAPEAEVPQAPTGEVHAQVSETLGPTTRRPAAARRPARRPLPHQRPRRRSTIWCIWSGGSSTSSFDAVDLCGTQPKTFLPGGFLTGGEGLRETYRAGPVARAWAVSCARASARGKTRLRRRQLHDKHLQARLRVQSQLRGVLRRRSTRGGLKTGLREASEAERMDLDANERCSGQLLLMLVSSR